MLVRQLRHLAPTGRALDEALLDEERLVDFLYRAGVLAQGGGDGGQAHGTALKLVDDGGQQFVVYLVQAVAVDVQCLQGIGGNLRVIRGVPRLREAISCAAFVEQGTFRIPAERRTMPASTSLS